MRSVALGQADQSQRMATPSAVTHIAFTQSLATFEAGVCDREGKALHCEQSIQTSACIGCGEGLIRFGPAVSAQQGVAWLLGRARQSW